MLKSTLCVAITIVLLASCTDHAAKEFNDHLVIEQNSIMPAVIAADMKLNDLLARGEKDSIIALTTRMEKLIETKRKSLEAEKLPTVAGAKDYAEAFINYYKYEQSVYEAYRYWAGAKNDKDKQYGADLIIKLEDQSDKYTDYMRRCQRIYAEKNNLRVNRSLY